MADLFLTSPGRVAAIDGPGVPMSIFLENWSGFFMMKSIITGIKGHQQTGTQLQHCLRDFIYIYVFGNRAGKMIISGLSFWQLCPGGGPHGIELVNSYYLQNMNSQRAAPLVIVIGLSAAFMGFMTGFDFSYDDPVHQIAQFQLHLEVIPEASDLG